MPDLRTRVADARSRERLTAIEELASVPPERGGARLTEWERAFVASVRARLDAGRPLSEAQREKLAELALDVEKGRALPSDRSARPANLFSRLSPSEQARQRQAAEKVRLPWE